MKYKWERESFKAQLNCLKSEQEDTLKYLEIVPFNTSLLLCLKDISVKYNEVLKKRKPLG